MPEERRPIRDPTNAEVARQMRLVRDAAKLNREQLAEQSMVGFQSIRSYETGRVLPGLANLWRLCDTLDVSMDEYTGFDNYRRRKRPPPQ